MIDLFFLYPISVKSRSDSLAGQIKTYDVSILMSFFLSGSAEETKIKKPHSFVDMQLFFSYSFFLSFFLTKSEKKLSLLHE